MKVRKNQLILAIAVIVLELIGGMQSYVSQLILPIMSADFHAQHLYGLITGVSSIASMLGLPIGAALLQRYKLPRLLIIMTAILCGGSVISATSVNIWMYVVGQFIRGFAGSTLAMASIGAVALGLSGRARQLTLAFSSASWVISSLVGPTYGAWVTHLLSWRWAMLLYLPFLLAARFVIAFSLNSQQKTQKTPLPLTAAIGMCLGVLLTILPARGWSKYLLSILGILILCWVTVKLMPRATFTENAPRKRALAGMFFLTAAYYSANELITLTAHDLYNANAAQLGWIQLAGGLGWAVMGLICGMKPATTAKIYRLRAGIGVGAIILSSVAAALMILGPSLVSSHMMISDNIASNISSNMIIFCLIFWALCGLGMGVTYVDTLNIFFEEPLVDDHISIEEIFSASVMVESLSNATFVPLITSLVSIAFQRAASKGSTVPGQANSGHAIIGMGFSSGSFLYGLAWVLIVFLALVAWIYLHQSGPKASVPVNSSGSYASDDWSDSHHSG